MVYQKYSYFSAEFYFKTYFMYSYENYDMETSWKIEQNNPNISLSSQVRNFSLCRWCMYNCKNLNRPSAECGMLFICFWWDWKKHLVCGAFSLAKKRLNSLSHDYSFTMSAAVRQRLFYFLTVMKCYES